MLKPRSHMIELEVPEMEICIDCSTSWDPDAERYERPDDEVVQDAVATLVERHHDELMDLCADRCASAREESCADFLVERKQAEQYYDGRQHG